VTEQQEQCAASECHAAARYTLTVGVDGVTITAVGLCPYHAQQIRNDDWSLNLQAWPQEE
jgi:hypothetical protein